MAKYEKKNPVGILASLHDCDFIRANMPFPFWRK